MSHRKHLGTGMIIGGALIAALFLVFIFIAPIEPAGAASPLWIGAIWGLLSMCWGIFRFVAGPSKLDHPHGGTDAGS